MKKRIFFLQKFCFGFKRIISKIFLQEMGQSSRMSWTKILEQIVRKEKRILLQTLAPRQNLARLILKKLLEILFSPCIIRSNLFRTILKKKNDNAWKRALFCDLSQAKFFSKGIYPLFSPFCSFRDAISFGFCFYFDCFAKSCKM